VAADGPREDHPGDKEKCDQTRKIIDQVDWDCEIKTLFRSKNLGCKYAVSEAINWFFENVEQGIILEDDCLPDQSFFWFCQELLNKYKNNKQIFNISGNNFQDGMWRGDGSYYFSKYFHCWGWATWADRWNKYFDIDMKTYSDFKKGNKIRKLFNLRREQKYWMDKFEKVYLNKVDTWDYIWTFHCWDNNGITCLPNKNLVKNIGFDVGATHTKNTSDKKANLSLQLIEFPLSHPTRVQIDHKADRYTSKNHFKINFKKTKLWKILSKIKSGLKL
jgi:hypothetical protein